MSIGSYHNTDMASSLCDCPEHTEARAAGIEARKIVTQILEASRAGNTELVRTLSGELESVNMKRNILMRQRL